MSVRRLDLVQPSSFAFSPENLSWAKRTIANYPAGKQASAVIQLLWRAQEQNNGWISRAAIEAVGKMLDMAFIRVYEVATFYTMFQLSPVGSKAHIQVCGTTPCMLRGSEDLMEVCKRKIHPEPHHLNGDGTLSWEEVECLGSCVNAPMVQVWKDTYEDLTAESFEKLIDDWQVGQRTKAGPQNGRHFSMAITGATSLNDSSLYDKPRSFTRVEAPPPPPPAAPPPVAPVATGPAPTAAAATIEGAKSTPTPPATAPAAAPVTAAPAAPAPNAAPHPQAANTEPQKLGAVRIKTPVERVKRVESPAIPIVTTPIVTTPSVVPLPAVAGPAKPELLKKPRGKADDLKLIWGIGPALEKMLNSIGIWHFDQVANWSSADLKYVDELLIGFKGRAKRDEWVKQAKKLAKGARPENPLGDRPGNR